MEANTIKTKTAFGTPIQKGNVTIYPAVPAEMLRFARIGKIKAAAYVRVSTDSVEQESSLLLQKEYYENFIKSNIEYEFVGIYEDDGVSATNVEKRKGFLKMMEDCKAGKIDLIFTKDITRFSRNTGDLLHYLNMLNALNPPVEIRFEADRTSTLSKFDEMYITLRGAFAQEESHNKSKTITWAIDNLFDQGKFYVPAVYGYTKEKGRDNPLIINEEEAKIVRLCYAMAVSGYSFPDIANTLNTLGIKGRLGNTNWKSSGVISLLSTEKYTGNFMARKTITPNYKTHKSKKNEGEKPKYHVKNYHKAIIPQLAYNVALKIIKNRRGNINGIPYLKAVPEGILKSFVTVNKTTRGYTLNDYMEASRSVYEEDNKEINIFADKVSIFDLRTYDTVSSLFFNDRTKPTCSIKNGNFSFNTACQKAFGAEKVEILFHPIKAILALRSLADENDFQGISIAKPICLSSFVNVALESAGLKTEYKYRIYGTKRTKNGENIMFFELQNVQIISKEISGYMLPNKYAGRYGDGYYENLTACDLHKIDFEGTWQALQESKPADSFAEQIIELSDFCQNNLGEFGLLKEITK